MTVAAGTARYALGMNAVKGHGYSWSEEELDSALDAVSATVHDCDGTSDLKALLSGLAYTEFARQELERVLGPTDDLEPWRVGEAIAETYLSDHRRCAFPWPDSRDVRRSGSSLPGADLVGFHTDESGDRFAFGEVKTSSEHRNPPQVMTGRHGLTQQIEELRDRVDLRDDLVKYLCHRARHADWRGRYQAAARRYLQNNREVRLFGALIRDVTPHENDLRGRVAALTPGCPPSLEIELLAIYLPQDSIVQLPAKVKTGAETQSTDVGGDE